MPEDTSRGLKGELLGGKDTVSRVTLAAMPGPAREGDVADWPSVSINGTTYTWKPGETDGIPEEALEVWYRSQEANP